MLRSVNQHLPELAAESFSNSIAPYEQVQAVINAVFADQSVLDKLMQTSIPRRFYAPPQDPNENKGDRFQGPWMMSQESLNEVYDPELPTLGILPSQFNSIPLIMRSAHRLKNSQDPQAINVVLLPNMVENSYFLVEQAGMRTALYAQRGSMCDQHGFVVSGTFPKPVRIDVLAYFSSEPTDPRVEYFERNGIAILNNKRFLEISRDKSMGSHALQMAGLKTPAQLFLGRLSENSKTINEAMSEVEEFVNLHGANGIVVKPVNGSQGAGVFMYNKDEIHKAIESIRAKYDQRNIIIEQRIQRAELKMPGCDDLLDWNLRVIATTEGVVDMEARVGAWGKPVNKSKGATIHEAHEIIKLSRESGANLPENILELITSEVSAAAYYLNGGMQGYDVIITDEGERYYVEVNGGCVGGLNSLYDLRENSEDKYRATETFAKHIGDIAARERKARPEKGSDFRQKTRKVALDAADNSPLFKYRVAVSLLAKYDEITKHLAVNGLSVMSWLRGLEQGALQNNISPGSAKNDDAIQLLYEICKIYNYNREWSDTLRIHGMELDFNASQRFFDLLAADAHLGLGNKEAALSLYEKSYVKLYKLPEEKINTMLFLAIELNNEGFATMLRQDINHRRTSKDVLKRRK